MFTLESKIKFKKQRMSRKEIEELARQYAHRHGLIESYWCIRLAFIAAYETYQRHDPEVSRLKSIVIRYERMQENNAA